MASKMKVYDAINSLMDATVLVVESRHNINNSSSWYRAMADRIDAQKALYEVIDELVAVEIEDAIYNHTSPSAFKLAIQVD